MKVVCTHETYKGFNMYLTYGKAYEVIDQFQINDQMYQIIDDNGRKGWFDRKVVIPIEEWREKQLNELGIVV